MGAAIYVGQLDDGELAVGMSGNARQLLGEIAQAAASILIATTVKQGQDEDALLKAKEVLFSAIAADLTFLLEAYKADDGTVRTYEWANLDI